MHYHCVVLFLTGLYLKIESFVVKECCASHSLHISAKQAQFLIFCKKSFWREKTLFASKANCVKCHIRGRKAVKSVELSNSEIFYLFSKHNTIDVIPDILVKYLIVNL